MITKCIVDQIMEGGQFLKQTGPNHQWGAISKTEARLKVAQSFQYHKRRLGASSLNMNTIIKDSNNSLGSDKEPEDFNSAPEDRGAISTEGICLQAKPHDAIVELAVKRATTNGGGNQIIDLNKEKASA